MLCILTSFWMLHAPKSSSKQIILTFPDILLLFKCFWTFCLFVWKRKRCKKGDRIILPIRWQCPFKDRRLWLCVCVRARSIIRCIGTIIPFRKKCVFSGSLKLLDTQTLVKDIQEKMSEMDQNQYPKDDQNTQHSFLTITEKYGQSRAYSSSNL